VASAARDASPTVVSGLAGYTFMKSTASGWEGYVIDEYTTLPETRDRLSANNTVFVATGEPHGQIECTVGRG